jgi:hypothetical protein
VKWVILALACAACASTPSTDNFNRPFSAQLPRDVRLFVIDAQACAHFSSEPRGDEPERDRFLDRMSRKACNGLIERRDGLLHRYKQSPEVTGVIKEAWASEGLIPAIDP